MFNIGRVPNVSEALKTELMILVRAYVQMPLPGMVIKKCHSDPFHPAGLEYLPEILTKLFVRLMISCDLLLVKEILHHLNVQNPSKSSN